MDRVESDDSKQKLCKPYHFFKSTIYEERIDMCGVGADLLTEEITDLERNNGTGRIDHPDGGMTGSKDISDAVCGAVWNASQHAEEFAYDYGETLGDTLSANTEQTAADQQQVLVDFQQEMQKMFDPMQKSSAKTV